MPTKVDLACLLIHCNVGPLFKSMGPFFTHLEHWSTEFYKAIQYDPQTIYELKNYLHEAGFYNIIQETMELPVGEWSESKGIYLALP